MKAPAFVIRTLAAAFLLAGAAFAQTNYPLKPVRIIVPTATGGPGDGIARLIAQGLTERLGKQVVVENRTGAGTMIGSELVAKAPADGHTLLIGLSTLATNPTAYKRVPYDAVKDFAPVTQVLSMANLMVSHPTLPARSGITTRMRRADTTARSSSRPCSSQAATS